MATTITTAQTVIDTTPTLIATGVVGASWLHMHAPAGGNQIYIGDATVSTTTGFELHKGQTVIVWLPESGKIYGVVASATETLPWLLTGGR